MSPANPQQQGQRMGRSTAGAASQGHIMAGFGSSVDFWVVVIGLTLGIAALLLLSLAVARRPKTETVLGRDIQIYRDQLAGVERDLARGTLSDSEGTKLRTEVARRLLEADRRSGRSSTTTATQSRKALILPGLIVLAALAGGVALYAELGQPRRLDLPLAARIADADQRLATRPSQASYLTSLAARPAPEVEPDLAALMEKLRQAVDPSTATDLKGLQLLAYNEARMANFPNAIAAQRRLIAVKAEAVTGDDYTGLAEMLVAQAEGYVSPEAETALTEALKRDPQNKAAQYYSGLLYAQGGRFDKAFAIWQPLMASATAADAWATRLAEDIAFAAEAAGVRYTPPALQPVVSASEAPVSEVEAKAAGAKMVEQLATRLAAEGGTAEEWARLITSLSVLDRHADAIEILAEARQNHPDGSDRAVIDAAAAAAGLE